MTVLNTSNKIRTQGDGVVVDFTFDFKAFNDSDLTVYIIDADNDATLQTLNTDFTVDIDEVNEGGTVTFASAPAASEEVLIVRVLPLTQTTDIPNVSNIREEQLENVYDTLEMQIQQLQEQLERAILQPITGDLDLVLPEPESDKYIGWNTAATALENKDAPDGLNIPGFTMVALTPGATIATNAALSHNFRVTVAQSFTLSNPTNPNYDGQKLTWRIKQDGTGGWAMTLGAKFRLSNLITDTTIEVAAGAETYMSAMYNLAEDKWDVVGFNDGFRA